MLTLLLFSFAMLVGCYFAGCIPLAFSLSPSKLKLITVFGAGLLVGTALAVIIPEGVHTMYSPQHHSHQHSASAGTGAAESQDKVGGSHLALSRRLEAVEKPSKIPLNPKMSREVQLQLDAKQPNNMALVPHQHQEQAALPLHHGVAVGPNDKSGIQGGQAGGALQGTVISEESDDDHGGDGAHRKIGLALVLGFVFMLLVDHCSGHGRSHADVETGSIHRHKNITATVGLVVHAAADGVALGAAASMSQLHVEIIVFAAIMLHKGPAAFALVSFLLHDGFDRSRIRRHLLVFSLAAPVGAILTYLVLLQQHVMDAQATGFALLFSAGTFLYVATVHVLPEVASTTTTVQHHSAAGVGDLGPLEVVKVQTGFSIAELILLLVGSGLPLLLSLGHSH